MFLIVIFSPPLSGNFWWLWMQQWCSSSSLIPSCFPLPFLFTCCFQAAGAYRKLWECKYKGFHRIGIQGADIKTALNLFRVYAVIFVFWMLGLDGRRRVSKNTTPLVDLWYRKKNAPRTLGDWLFDFGCLEVRFHHVFSLTVYIASGHSCKNSSEQITHICIYIYYMY